MIVLSFRMFSFTERSKVLQPGASAPSNLAASALRLGELRTSVMPDGRRVKRARIANGVFEL